MQRASGMYALLLAMAFGHVGMAARVRHHRSYRRKSVNVTSFGVGKGSFHMRVQQGTDGCQVLDAEWGQLHRKAVDRVFEKEPKWVWTDEQGAEQDHSDEKFIDFWGPSEEVVRAHVEKACGGHVAAAPPQTKAIPDGTDVRCIVCSGDSSNRIDVVFMGDGYTMEERTRFFEDMQRLTDEMFEGVTFRSWLPVFNIWAIHVPSNESGIGYYDTPNDTPFKLYKQGTVHRAVLYTQEGQDMAVEVCKLAGGCDYPSLIGNDEFYGGLGGFFVIGTRSKTTGTVVLRHEMGHNFVSVGEEYDGGYVYRGVNAESSDEGQVPVNRSVKWEHWLTEPDEPLREERMMLPLQVYPWVDLAPGPQTFSFNSTGTYARWKMSFTVSGFPEEGSLKVFLDGQQLAWTPSKPPGAERPDGSTVDRQFYHYADPVGFTEGTHTLTFESGSAPPEGAPIRQLCNIVLHEFGSDEEFNSQPGYVGLYPTWNYWGGKSYRPTNDMCLMRSMESTAFCPVCKEGMWMQFMARMSLIDTVEVSRDEDQVTVELKAVPLAHLRQEPIPGFVESYRVEWFKDGEVQNQMTDQWTFSANGADISGSWEVRLHYTNEEVRSDPDGLLSANQTFTIEAPAPTPAPPDSGMSTWQTLLVMILVLGLLVVAARASSSRTEGPSQQQATELAGPAT